MTVAHLNSERCLVYPDGYSQSHLFFKSGGSRIGCRAVVSYMHWRDRPTIAKSYPRRTPGHRNAHGPGKKYLVGMGWGCMGGSGPQWQGTRLERVFE